MNFEYNDPIIIQQRQGTIDSPFSDKNETHTVGTDGKVILSEVPNEYNHVAVDSGDGQVWYEIRGGLPGADEFQVAYNHSRTVTFNTSNIGKQLNFVYKGEGLVFMPYSSIYTNQTNDTVTETLKTALNNLKGLNNYTIVPTYSGDRLSKVEEKEGTTVVNSSMLTYNVDGTVNTVTEVVNGESVVYTLSYSNGEFASVSKTLGG